MPCACSRLTPVCSRFVPSGTTSRQRTFCMRGESAYDARRRFSSSTVARAASRPSRAGTRGVSRDAMTGAPRLRARRPELRRARAPEKCALAAKPLFSKTRTRDGTVRRRKPSLLRSRSAGARWKGQAHLSRVVRRRSGEERRSDLPRRGRRSLPALLPARRWVPRLFSLCTKARHRVRLRAWPPPSPRSPPRSHRRSRRSTPRRPPVPHRAHRARMRHRRLP